jgi:hypothetical protein
MMNKSKSLWEMLDDSDKPRLGSVSFKEARRFAPRLRNNNKVTDHAIDLDIFDNGVWDSGSLWAILRQFVYHVETNGNRDSSLVDQLTSHLLG